MSSEWQTLPIGEIGKVVTGKTPSTAVDHYYGGEYPFYTPSDMDGRKRLESTRRSLSAEGIDSIRGSIIEAGAVMVSCIGSDMGKVAIAANKGATNQQINTILVSQGFDPEYIYYELSTRKDELQMLATGGSAQPILNKGHFCQVGICVPPLPEQKAIAHILGTLDDKIELNRKTNETLEAMAKALFKSWFVDFDPVRAKAEGRPTGLPAEISDLFPDSFEDSELGEIPSGWQCCPFTQRVDVISGGTPKTSVDEYWNGSVPWFSVVDAPSGSDCWVMQTEKRITHQGLNSCSSKLLSTGTTIISARGTVGKVCLTGQDMAMNQSCYGLKSKGEGGEYFCFYLTKSLVEILAARAHGSVFSTITRDTLDGVATVSPSLEIIQAFNGIAGALLGRIRISLQENQALTCQRDALLPKLISGELRIPDAEKLLEEVGL